MDILNKNRHACKVKLQNKAWADKSTIKTPLRHQNIGRVVYFLIIYDCPEPVNARSKGDG